ncbi:MAG: Lipoteichoic acid synthase 2 [Ferruginibacter sp.]|nr:Lipoteichoic acid synthase 2 [Ferruginibacter sp.]
MKNPLKYLVFVGLLLGALSARGSITEIRYHAPGATEVTMIWGINDWATTTNGPAGTTIKDGVMNSPMVREGEDYVIKIAVPDSSTIDCMFFFTKITGPFKERFNYLDVNEQPDKKYYYFKVKGNAVIRINPDLKKLGTTKTISVLKYAAVFFFIFTALAILLYLGKKFIFKTPFAPFKPTVLFFSVAVTLLITLVIVRAVITNESVQFLIDPLRALPLIFKTSFQDFLYTGILASLFGLLFFIRKNNRTLILSVFALSAILSIAICIINIKVTSMLGRPFNYQWLYYSDFLMSSDASNAIGNNIDKRSLLAYLIMILTVVPLGWLMYQSFFKSPGITSAILAVCFGFGFFAKNDASVDKGKTENPVIYFVSSLLQRNGLSILAEKNGVDINEFTKKNKNVLQPQDAAKFGAANIKNVIIFVLESTSAEYITPYNSKYQATPFLDSLKSSSLYFDAAYAHAPTTNMSMVSFLCGSYPYLSYKFITKERPDIRWPSISSELKKNGYRTSFFNSGDNRYMGADLFLQQRGFDEIADFKENTCRAPVFTGDPRYPYENMEGINDACLPVKFFNWIKNDRSTPFFSMMWTYQTHYPYYTTGKPIDFHSNNESLERYLNGLHDADKALRQLVEGLKARDLLNSTLIVVFGDHGEAFGRHGQNGHADGAYEENLHIPLILINPLLFNGGHNTEVAGMSDIAPTIFSILNKPIPNQWQGEDLFSIHRRNKVYFFSPFCWRFGCREGDYKLIYDANANLSYLYDLKTDPYESHNIADKNPKYVEELKKHLNTWIQYQVQYVKPFLK